MSTALVTTTIYVPKLLDAYFFAAAKKGMRDFAAIVIGDKKTPTETAHYCAQLERRYGLSCEYHDVARQEQYLKKYPELGSHLPWNSVERRVVGMVRAYELGFDTIISLDDDNYLADENYFGAIQDIGKTITLPSATALRGWMNICDTLAEENNRRFYCRGYPMLERWKDAPENVIWDYRTGRLAVIGGFWLEDPDIDAIQRLTCPIRVTGYARKENFVLGKDTWSPFNSQNTALARSVIPAYFLSPCVGRYSDIWASFVIMAIVGHLDELVSFGRPMVRQDRNPHNYFKDFDNERIGLEISDRFCEILRAIKFVGKDYVSCFNDILVVFDRALEDEEWNDRDRMFVANWILGCRVWQETFARMR